MPTYSLVVLSCFFFSGLAGLIYQVLWLRMVDKVLGSAPFAVATVLTVFMGGLALGSWLAGKHIDRIKSRSGLLALYGKVEVIIGIYGLLLPFLIIYAKPVYILAYNSLLAHFWLYRIFTFFGCSLLLLVPTTLMGVTLPVLCRFYVESLGHVGTRTGRLYGINTIGGAAGAILCGFFLIARFGVWGSILTAAGINLVIGLLCILSARGDRPDSSWRLKKDNCSALLQGPSPPKTSGPDGSSPEGDRIIIILALWIFAISGFCAMAYEVFWTRLLGLIIGPTTYSFSLVVSTFIIGLALGNIIFGRLADRVKGTFRLLVVTQACAACLALIVSQFLGNSHFFFSKLLHTFQDNFGAKLLAQSMALFFVLLGPTIFLGATFPLVNRIHARSLPEVGRSIGTAYAVNTLGAILGSFIAGFIFIPLLGKENGLRLTAGFQFFTAFLALAYLAYRSGNGIRATATVFAALCLGSILLINIPSWNHKILSKGWYRQTEFYKSDFNSTSWLEAIWKGASKFTRYVSNFDVVFFGDGIGGFTTVVKRTSPIGTVNYTLLNSGKKEANSHTSRLSQALPAHIPLLFHPDPEKVMIVGLASGMTAGETLLYPVRQLDVLEINDQVVKSSNYFNAWNNNCLSDPRTRLLLQDGRNHLELTRETYDVIISSPSDPWMAGLASLFTLDYFRIAKKRLNENGIFVQWISAYDMDWESFAMVGRSFAEVFPESLLINMNDASDLLLVGFSKKKIMDLETADRNIVYAAQSKNLTIRDPRVFFNFIVTEDLNDFFGPGPFHTDNWPRLEFAAPKNLDRTDHYLSTKLAESHRLSEETMEIVSANKSIDLLLDNIELMLADSSPPFNDVNLDTATRAQENRYQSLLENFCSCRDVTRYSIFPNSDLQEKCARIQAGMIQEHLTADPENSQAYNRLALAYKAMGSTRDEMVALRKTIALTPSNYNAYMELGNVYISQKRFDEAINQFSEALKINPNHAEAYNNIGNALVAQGKTADALLYYSRALDANPELLEAHDNLANALLSQGKFEEAVVHFSRALEIDPDHVKTHLDFGRLLATQGKFEEALSHFNEALETAPHNPDLHTYAGMVLGQQGQMDSAVDHLHEALGSEPKHFLALKNLGITLLRQGKLEDAADQLSRASEIKPGDPSVHTILGMILINQGQLEAAMEQYSTALNLEPDSAENHDNLGVAFAMMGKLEDAILHFKQAIQIDNSYKNAHDHLKTAQMQISQ
jgi:spermidine synthase